MITKLNKSLSINSQNNHAQTDKINELIDSVNGHETVLYTGVFADNISSVLTDYDKQKVEIEVTTTSKKIYCTGYILTDGSLSSISGWGITGEMACIRVSIGPSTVTTLYINGSNALATETINGTDVTAVLITKV